MFLLEFAWPSDPNEIRTLTIELGIFIVGIIAGIIGLMIWRQHRTLAKKGLPECIMGFFVFAFHSLFDGLDTIATIDPLGDNLDLLDSIFSIVGLILIAIGIIRISLYGSKIWREM